MTSPTDHLISIILDNADDIRLDPESGLIFVSVPEVIFDRRIFNDQGQEVIE